MNKLTWEEMMTGCYLSGAGKWRNDPKPDGHDDLLARLKEAVAEIEELHHETEEKYFTDVAHCNGLNAAKGIIRKHVPEAFEEVKE